MDSSDSIRFNGLIRRTHTELPFDWIRLPNDLTPNFVLEEVVKIKIENISQFSFAIFMKRAKNDEANLGFRISSKFVEKYNILRKNVMVEIKKIKQNRERSNKFNILINPKIKYTIINTKGISLTEISETTKLSQNRVLRVPKYKDLIKLEIGRLYLDGHGLKFVSKEVGVAVKTLKNWRINENLLQEVYKQDLSNLPIFEGIASYDDFIDNARKTNYRLADLVVANKQKLMIILYNSIVDNLKEIIGDVKNIGKVTGFSSNIVDDWIVRHRLEDELQLSQSKKEKLYVFQNTIHAAINPEDLVEKINKKSITENMIKKKLGLNIKKITNQQRSVLYKNFVKLENYIGEKIKHEVVRLKKHKPHTYNTIYLRDVYAAELIGYMLGDGSFSSEISVTLHLEEIEIQKRVKFLLKKVIGRKIEFREKKYFIAARFTTSSKSVIAGFESLDLTRGNKKENQISVPSWISKKERFAIPTLKGLLDTDGKLRIHKNKKGQITRVSTGFSNSSQPLHDFMHKICDKFEIKYNQYKTETEIYNSDHALKLLRIVKPIKFGNIIKKFPEINEL